MDEQPVILGGRYRVEGELGRGGMAKVFRGTDTVLGRPVAIKVLAPRFSDDASFVQRFRREAQAAARLSNPNVVGVFDTGADDGVHYIVMEYVEGRTLAEELAGGRILPERAIEIAQAVCDALAAAHAQGVIHRDIKPGNIMLTPSGQVKVADFGIARLTTSAETIEQTAAVLGTAAYLSPEQAQGRPVDARSDLYSLGCVLYEMVTGRPPFVGDSPVAVASKQVLEPPTPPSKLNPDVSPELEAVILRALAKNPDNRYASATEMREDLERARRGLPVEAPAVLPESASTQVLRPGPRTEVLPPPEPERSRWWVPALVLGGLLAAIGAVLWLFAGDVLGGRDRASPTPQLVQVPEVIGMRVRAAEEAIREAGLKVGERIEQPIVDLLAQEPWTVVDQDPAPSEQVPVGTPVTLTVLVPPETVTIPPTTGMTEGETRAALEALGFVVAGVREEPSGTIDVGRVIGTDPPAGTAAPYRSEVTIIVSTGPGSVIVPEVRCQSFSSAQNELVRAGLEPVISDEPVSINPACPLGNKVAQQDPPPGTEVAPGTRVVLYPGASPSPTGPTGPTGE